MKKVSILLIILVVALALGCVGPKQSDTDAGIKSVSPGVDTPVPAQGTDELDEFGLEDDLLEIDSLLSDSELDISLSEVNNDLFT